MSYKDTVDDRFGIKVEGHIRVFDPDTLEEFQNKRNAVHYENMSVALANSLSNSGQGLISELAFGSGGTIVDTTGFLTYLTPNTNGINSNLYNKTYSKVVDSNSSLNIDPVHNKMEVRHLSGMTYTDIVVSCLLDYGEPNGQDAFDNSANLNSDFIFDEMGLISADGKLLTHCVFHPTQKSLNRRMQVDYTLRIYSLASVGG